MPSAGSWPKTVGRTSTRSLPATHDPSVLLVMLDTRAAPKKDIATNWRSPWTQTAVSQSSRPRVEATPQTSKDIKIWRTGRVFMQYTCQACSRTPSFISPSPQDSRKRAPSPTQSIMALSTCILYNRSGTVSTLRTYVEGCPCTLANSAKEISLLCHISPNGVRSKFW